MITVKREKVRLGLLNKLRPSIFSNPQKDIVKLFNSNLKIINSILDGYFYIPEASPADIEESDDSLIIKAKDSFTSLDGSKFTLNLELESYYSDSYKQNNNSFVFALMRKVRSREEKFCYEKINDSVDDMKKSVVQISEKALKRLNIYTGSVIGESEERTDVIRKVGNSWRILGKRTKYWPAHYKTKTDAENALKAYWANKHECRNKNSCRLVVENFSDPSGKDLLHNLHSFLGKIFGPTLYFDHCTDNSADLYYKGKLIAELIYKRGTDEIVVMPDDIQVAPVSFYDTSEAEINDYLSDLILGDL